MFAIVPSKASCTQNYILACQSLNCHPYTFNISFEFATLQRFSLNHHHHPSPSCRMKCVTVGCLGGFVQELCCDDQEAELLDVEMKPPSDPQVLRIVKVTVPVPPMRWTGSALNGVRAGGMLSFHKTTYSIWMLKSPKIQVPENHREHRFHFKNPNTQPV